VSGKRKNFSWSVFLAVVLATFAMAVLVAGGWYYFTQVGESSNTDYRNRVLNLWVLMAISLVLLSLSTYLLPKRHARWLSPIQKSIVLALLAHIILVTVTRLALVSKELVVEAQPPPPTIQLQSAPELKVSQAIRKQTSDLAVQDPTLVQTAKAEVPKPKPARPKKTDTTVPKAQPKPKPMEMKPIQRKLAKSTAKALEAAAKMEALTPRLRQMRQAKPLKQQEERPAAQQKPRLSPAATVRPSASAQPHEQKLRRAQTERKQLTMAPQPVRVRTRTEARAQPAAQPTLRSIDASLTQASNQVAQVEKQAKTGSGRPATGARLARDTGSRASASKSVQVAMAPARTGGSSMAAATGRSLPGMATVVEQPAAARTEGLTGLQPIVTGMPGDLPAVQAGHSIPGREPSAGDAAGSQIGDTRLAETGAAGKGGSPGEVGVGNLGGPASGMGGSVAVAAAGGGGRVGHAIGTATQGGVGAAVAIHDGPQLTGPEGGGGTQATSPESSAGEREGQAASDRAYAGRQQVGTPGGSFTGDVQAAGGPAGHAGLGQLGSLLGTATGTARSLPGRGTAPGSGGSGISVDASSPAGAPDVTGPLGPAIAAVQGHEDSPGAVVGGPGVLAGPMTSPAGSGSGRGAALGMDPGAVGPAAGVAMGGSIAGAAAAGGRPVPGDDLFGRGTSEPRILPPRLDPKPKDVDKSNLFAHRTPETRKTITDAMGGSKETEAAVADALAFLARSQEPDGRWTRFTGDPKPGQHKRTDRDMGLTGLATLCFLAAGHTPDKPGPYQENVRNALAHLIARQATDGDLRNGGHMYSHGMASLAIIEAAIMTDDPTYKAASVKAAQFIINAQNAKSGGWRYKPGEQGDTSILGWQVMALYGVEHMGMEVPDKTVTGAIRWLDGVRSRTPHQALAGYTDRIPSPAMSAEAAFSRILLGQTLTAGQQQELCKYLLKFEPGKGRNDLFRLDDFYTWYYTALVLMQLQNDAWHTWNQQMQKRLLSIQRKDGAVKGSWNPKTKHSRLGGRIYTTATATLTLQVYYRYLPEYAKPKQK